MTFFVPIDIGECQPEITMSYSNHLTSHVQIKIGEFQLEMTMSYSNHLTSFVSIEIGDLSPFLCLFSSRSLLILLRTLPPLDCQKTPLGTKSRKTHGLF